jgi:hypothetical protein
MTRIAIGNFDHVTRGARIVKNSDPTTIYIVSDFKDGKHGETVLILIKLNAQGFNAGERSRSLADTPANRATWSRV